MVLGRCANRAGLQTAAALNLGDGENDFRVPDGGWAEAGAPPGRYMTTMRAVLEVVSPDDETWEKFGFYAEHGVLEVLVAHPAERWVQCWQLQNGRDVQVALSAVFDIAMDRLAADVQWP